MILKREGLASVVSDSSAWSLILIALDGARTAGGMCQDSAHAGSERCGLGNFDAAARFCRAYDEQRNYFHGLTKQDEKLSLPEQRQLFRQRPAALQDSLIAAEYCSSAEQKARLK